MKLEYRMILSMLLIALGIDYVIEGYTAAFIVIELLAVASGIYKTKVNYRNVLLATIVLSVIINLITVRIGLNKVMPLMFINNILFSLVIVIWFDVAENYQINHSSVISKAVVISNILFLLAIIFTMISDSRYFMYPAFYNNGGEVAMILIFAMVFEPIVMINSLLNIKKSIKAVSYKRIKMQNMLK